MAPAEPEPEPMETGSGADQQQEQEGEAAGAPSAHKKGQGREGAAESKEEGEESKPAFVLPDDAVLRVSMEESLHSSLPTSFSVFFHVEGEESQPAFVLPDDAVLRCGSVWTSLHPLLCCPLKSRGRRGCQRLCRRAKCAAGEDHIICHMFGWLAGWLAERDMHGAASWQTCFLSSFPLLDFSVCCR